MEELSKNFHLSTFDATRLPGVIDHWKANQAQNYLDNPNGAFRAIAVNDRGTAHTGWSRTDQTGPNSGTTQEEAIRRAFDFSEATSCGEHPCFLHTVGTETIWEPANTDWRPVGLKFAPNLLDVDNVPFMTDQDIESLVRPAVERFQSSAGSEHFIIVMGRFGRYPSVVLFSNPIDDPMRADVLGECNDAYATAFPAAPGAFQERCFIYSEDMGIVMTPGSYGSAVHFLHPSNQN